MDHAVRKLQSEQFQLKTLDPPWRIIYHECEGTHSFFLSIRSCGTPAEVIELLRSVDEYIAKASSMASIETIRAMCDWLIVAVLSMD
jgi:hypothetical protein